MGIQEELSAALFRLSTELPGAQDTQRLTMLAGNGLAQPMSSLRANQARREYERLAKRYPKDHPRRVRALARAEAAKIQVAAIDSEVDRLKVAPKDVQAGETAVHGYVRDCGEPVAGVEVFLIEAEKLSGSSGGNSKALSSTETFDDGSFALSAQSSTPLTLGVRRKRTMLHRETEPVPAGNGVSAYRILELTPGKDSGGDTKDCDDRKIEDCSKDTDPVEEDTKKADPILTDDLRGRTLHAALEAIRERELGLTGVHLTKGNVKTPEVIAVERASSEASVILHVATDDRPSARLDAIAALLGNNPHGDGTEIDTVSGAREWLRANEIGDLETFASWSKKTGKQIQKDGTLKDGRHAAKIKKALSSTRRVIREG